MNEKDTSTDLSALERQLLCDSYAANGFTTYFRPSSPFPAL